MKRMDVILHGYQRTSQTKYFDADQLNTMLHFEHCANGAAQQRLNRDDKIDTNDRCYC